jgi:hypothetical protein
LEIKLNKILKGAQIPGFKYCGTLFKIGRMRRS